MCVYLLKGAFSGMTHGLPKTGPEKLAQDLQNLGTRGDDELKDRWRELYGIEAPRKIHRSLLIPAILIECRRMHWARSSLPPAVI